MQCSRCQQDLPSTAKFCPTCGTTTAAAPIPPRDAPDAAPTNPPEGHGAVAIGTRPKRSAAPFVMTGLVLAALVLGGIAVVGTRASDDDTATGGRAGSSSPATAATTTPASIPATTPTTAATTTPLTAVDSTTTNTPTTLPTDPSEVALAALGETIAADRPFVDSHLGRWVPQISAKRNGIRWEGVDYDLPLILDLHRELDARHGALLVSGAEYNFEIDDNPMAGWFVTIVDESHDAPDGALDWCRRNDIDRDNCAAKLISNDQDAGQTLVLQ